MGCSSLYPQSWLPVYTLLPLLQRVGCLMRQVRRRFFTLNWADNGITAHVIIKIGMAPHEGAYSREAIERLFALGVDRHIVGSAKNN